jgi:hypothetical protein
MQKEATSLDTCTLEIKRLKYVFLYLCISYLCRRLSVLISHVIIEILTWNSTILRWISVGVTLSADKNSITARCLTRVDIALEHVSILPLLEIHWMNATTSNLHMRIEGECFFHMPPGALLKVISFALYKHVCITFQPTLVQGDSRRHESFSNLKQGDGIWLFVPQLNPRLFIRLLSCFESMNPVPVVLCLPT